MEDDNEICGGCKYLYLGSDNKWCCEWYDDVDFDDPACSWFDAEED